MGKLSNMAPAGATSAVRSASTTADTVTHEGAPGWTRDTKSELFLLATSNFVGEDTFYEDARTRDSRFVRLVREVAVADVDWMARFIAWLRGEGNMRSASIVAGIEAADAVGPVPGRRDLLVSAMQRADEPGEALGYWLATRGRRLPKWLKRALGDGIVKLYTEFSALKYDGQGKGIRFADVLELSQIEHGRFSEPLAKWLIDRRHKREWTSSHGLPMIAARERLFSVPQPADRVALITGPGGTERLRGAGMTWEAVGGWVQGPMTKAIWEALIPTMGYMALLRNLRNFDEAGVSDDVAAAVVAKLVNPEEVARSRQLPMRFLSAYKAAPSDRWKHALSVALDHSLAAIPELRGRTAILIDTSGSMAAGFSRDGTLTRMEAASVFGLALAKRLGPESSKVLSFSSNVSSYETSLGRNTLSELAGFRRNHFQGGGTNTPLAVRTAVSLGAERIVVLTDEQAGGYYGVESELAGFSGMFYTFNLAGYQAGHARSGAERRHTFAGLNDSGFRVMANIESGRMGDWPF